MGSSVRADTSLLPARRMSGEEEYECFGRSDVDLNPVAFLHAIDQIGRDQEWYPAYAEPCWGMQMETLTHIPPDGATGKGATRPCDPTRLLVAWKMLTLASKKRTCWRIFRPACRA